MNNTTSTNATRLAHIDDVDTDDKLTLQNIAMIALGMVATYLVVMGILRVILALGWHA